MRYRVTSGLAGLPGVTLDERDLRQIASHFRAGSMGGSGLSGSCTTCKGTTGSYDRDIAGAVADTLGLGELADAARDDSIPGPMAQANLLASATMQAIKFRSDQVAVLDGVTNSVFRRAVLGAANKLKDKMPAERAYLSALTLCYTNGAIDSAAGRNTPLAKGFKKASTQLADALRDKTHPQALAMLAGLGWSGKPSSSDSGYTGSVASQYYTNTTASSSGTSVASSYYTAPSTELVSNPILEERRSAAAEQGVASWERPESAANKPVYLNSPEYYYPPVRKNVLKSDLGSATAPPDEVEFVDPSTVLSYFDVLFRDGFLKNALNSTSSQQAKGDKNDWWNHNAMILSAWIYRQLTSEQASRLFGEWKKKNSTGDDSSRRRIVDAYVQGSYKLSITKTDRDGNLSADERRVVELLLIARSAALQRTGQIGTYASDGTWIIGSTGQEQTPFSTIEEAKIYLASDYKTLPAKPSVIRLAFASRSYRRAYRKEPTLSAINWYGSFGYGIPEGQLFGGTTSQQGKYADRIGKLEAVRMSGSAPPPEDLTDNTNIFMQLFNSLGSGLGWVLEKINQGVKYATEALCSMFKTLMGPEVGGVMCAIFTAILKIVAGGIKASIAAVVSVGRALAGAIGSLAQGKWMEAATAFFVGVNTAVVFLMGGSFAGLLGIPFLKSEETSTGTPSLERLGEELTKEDPLFLVNLTLAVIGAIVQNFSPPTIGGLIIALAPLVGFVLAPTIDKALQSSTDKALEKYKKLGRRAIAAAVGSIVKLIAAIVVGAMTAGGFMAVISAELQKFAEREGGSGAALVKSLQFFIQGLSSQLVGIIAAVASQPFNLQALLDGLWSLLSGFLLLIPVFALQMGFSQEGRSTAMAVSNIASQAAGEAAALAKKIQSDIAYASNVVGPAAGPAAAVAAVSGSATVCSTNAAGKVVETKIITNTVTKTEIPVPMLVGVAVVALAVGIAVSRR